ncbi:enoyl-CoA hydratase/isomerase family protein [Rhizorhabdus dicambivorans]|uniref:Enoyl-CoA hydratase/isomerase family protein n=1 Tax=Rhizorhabdus dicambivorans TaxID=1850238 RepID=A0A2A4FPT1_9SPHN|nr:enoyl-CoA hydratase/isomerase family protein [Rhizorhabdus dicambivorans]ATE64378.1 enoyl-CoA hydratase/isomerase family protein [Rhizorhabdus dicambivorans]PCE39712.1 enoyl-CoA hydratase/isomerase family protein [Rhizorhabdus dicambivorans]
MTYSDYKFIVLEKVGRVMTATVNSPPFNLVTGALMAELIALSVELEKDPDTLVFVLKSANPQFFLAHFDIERILDLPIEAAAERPRSGDSAYHAMCERFRSMDKITIAQVEGRVGGVGSELIMNFDMRFGVVGKTMINQMEVPLGILPGGTGTQQMPQLMGRARALEIILSGSDLDAETAERWGYLNRAFAPDAIGTQVAMLADRIASFPPDAVRLAKAAVDAAELGKKEGLLEEVFLFRQLLRTKDARQNMMRFLEIGGQTLTGECEIDRISAELNRP